MVSWDPENFEQYSTPRESHALVHLTERKKPTVNTKFMAFENIEYMTLKTSRFRECGIFEVYLYIEVRLYA